MISIWVATGITVAAVLVTAFLVRSHTRYRAGLGEARRILRICNRASGVLIRNDVPDAHKVEALRHYFDPLAKNVSDTIAGMTGMDAYYEEHDDER